MESGSDIFIRIALVLQSVFSECRRWVICEECRNGGYKRFLFKGALIHPPPPFAMPLVFREPIHSAEMILFAPTLPCLCSFFYFPHKWALRFLKHCFYSLTTLKELLPWDLSHIHILVNYHSWITVGVLLFGIPSLEKRALWQKDLFFFPWCVLLLLKICQC